MLSSEQACNKRSLPVLHGASLSLNKSVLVVGFIFNYMHCNYMYICIVPVSNKIKGSSYKLITLNMVIYHIKGKQLIGCGHYIHVLQILSISKTASKQTNKKEANVPRKLTRTNMVLVQLQFYFCLLF